jgi:UDP-glucose 4-epimerase
MKMVVRKLYLHHRVAIVYGKSDTPFSEDDALLPEISYGLSKVMTETYLRFIAKELNGKSISLRISNPYGEGRE